MTVELWLQPDNSLLQIRLYSEKAGMFARWVGDVDLGFTNTVMPLEVAPPPVGRRVVGYMGNFSVVISISLPE